MPGHDPEFERRSEALYVELEKAFPKLFENDDLDCDDTLVQLCDWILRRNDR